MSLAKAILGAATPAELDVFESIGDLIPPRESKRQIKDGRAPKIAYPEKVTVDDAALQETLRLLDTLIAAGGVPARRAAAYAKCVQAVVDARK